MYTEGDRGPGQTQGVLVGRLNRNRWLVRFAGVGRLVQINHRTFTMYVEEGGKERKERKDFGRLAIRQAGRQAGRRRRWRRRRRRQPLVTRFNRVSVDIIARSGNLCY